MSGCPHPVIYQGLCAACGQDVSALPAARPAVPVKPSAQPGGATRRSRPQSSTTRTADGVAEEDDEYGSPTAHGGSHAIVLGGHHKTIHLSSAALQERTRSNTIDLMAQRKLICVLDLDHTLLHATSDPRVRAWVDKEPDLHQFLLGHGPSVRAHYVKLRPGLAHFLENTSKLFDLHVYTMGARAYADAVVPIFDPTHRFIKHRVVSRDEGGESVTSPEGVVSIQHHSKSLKKMYPCDEGLIGIVDDRVDVWAGNAKNVVRAFEFMYFSGRTGEINSRPDGHRQAEPDLPIAPHQLASHPHPDNVLISLTAVLDAVHQLFYGQVDKALLIPSSSSGTGDATDGPPKRRPVSDVFPLSADMSVPRLISLAKLTTLEGCVIVFSGVFPTLTKDGQPLNRGAGAQKAEAWIHATAFGAICLEDFPGVNTTTGEEVKEDDDQVVPFGVDSVALSRDPPMRVTHLVAARDGSPKLRYAAKLPDDVRPAVVHVSWLWHSLAHFQRGDEHLFPLWSDAKKDTGSSPQASPIAESTPAEVEAPSPSSSSSTAMADVPSPATEGATVLHPIVIEPVTPPAMPQSTAAVISPASSVSTLSLTSGPAASTAAASTSTITTVGGIRRRVTKKVAPAEMNSTPAASAAASSAPFIAASPASTTGASPAPPALTKFVAPPSVPLSAAEKYRYSLHLVHHCQHPPTAASLVDRIQQHLRAAEEKQRAQEALADLTRAREMVKAQTLQARRRSSGLAGTTPAAAAAAQQRRKKSVSFSSAELGPTNPKYDEEAHTMSDVDMAGDGVAAAGDSMAAESQIASLKRKAHVPLDDVDRLHKERKVGDGGASAAAAAAAPSGPRRSLKDIQAEADAVMHVVDGDDDASGITVEELDRQFGDSEYGAYEVGQETEVENALDPFDIGDAFDDVQEYEGDQFQDDE